MMPDKPMEERAATVPDDWRGYGEPVEVQAALSAMELLDMVRATLRAMRKRGGTSREIIGVLRDGIARVERQESFDDLKERSSAPENNSDRRVPATSAYD